MFHYAAEELEDFFLNTESLSSSKLKMPCDVFVETTNLVRAMVNSHSHCHICGRKIKFFQVIKDGRYFYLKAYGFNSHNHLVEFNGDHLIPLSKGGPTNHVNLVPACTQCNRKKANKIDHPYIELIDISTTVNFALNLFIKKNFITPNVPKDKEAIDKVKSRLWNITHEHKQVYDDVVVEPALFYKKYLPRICEIINVETFNIKVERWPL
jgi:hypothetical protein